MRVFMPYCEHDCVPRLVMHYTKHIYSRITVAKSFLKYTSPEDDKRDIKESVNTINKCACNLILLDT